MTDQIVVISLTDRDQARLKSVVEHYPDLGSGVFALVEDVIARKAWDALPAKVES